jgi:hypothetical protein
MRTGMATAKRNPQRTATALAKMTAIVIGGQDKAMLGIAITPAAR